MRMKRYGALVVLFAATTASAVYIPGPLPPGTFGGGVVSPDEDVFKDQQKAARAQGKLFSSVAKCYLKGAKNVSNGNPDDIAACLGTGNPSGRGALDKYAKTIGGLPNLPSCHDYSVASDGNLIHLLVRSFQPMVYCPVCGNGIVEAGEDCEGADLNGQTCVSQGGTGGTLACQASCFFDYTNCTF